ncbi:hypothetical protein [Kitasatospora sp. NPDC057500]|uniref:hypothetical protein n=1 Tax=Kitasatospora sp. NPDC057500 TaxID=3346151 RepID=UPI0036BF2445
MPRPASSAGQHSRAAVVAASDVPNQPACSLHDPGALLDPKARSLPDREVMALRTVNGRDR